LEQKHPGLTAALMKKKESLRSGSTGKRAIQMHLDKKARLTVFNQDGLRDLLVKYAVLTDQSFLGMEHWVFQELMEYVHPGIVLPKRKAIKKNLLNVFETKKEELKQRLKKVQFLLFKNILIVG
jgi:hypothetical protein